MSKYYTLREAFNEYEIAVPHPRQCWSGRDKDGVPCLAVWEHQLQVDPVSLEVMYSNFEPPALGTQPWMSSPANKQRIKEIQHAIDTYDGYIRIILVTAADPSLKALTIRHVNTFPQKALKINKFNDQTGEFNAYVVSKFPYGNFERVRGAAILGWTENNVRSSAA